MLDSGAPFLVSGPHAMARAAQVAAMRRKPHVCSRLVPTWPNEYLISTSTMLVTHRKMARAHPHTHTYTEVKEVKTRMPRKWVKFVGVKVRPFSPFLA